MFHVPPPDYVTLALPQSSRRGVLSYLGHRMASDLGRPQVGIMDAIAHAGHTAQTQIFIPGGMVVLDVGLVELDHPYWMMARLQRPLFWDHSRTFPVTWVVLWARDDQDSATNMRLLSRLTRRLHDPHFRDVLGQVPTPDAVRALWDDMTRAAA